MICLKATNEQVEIMLERFSERRLAENEVIFKEMNERIKQAVTANFGKQAVGLPLEFYCECSDKACQERIVMAADQFTAAHANPKRFIIRKSHEKASIERVVEACDDYDIVEKFQLPPPTPGGQLNPTLEA